MPLEAPFEMAIDWPVSLGRLKDLPESRRILAARPDRAIDRELVMSSLAAYVGTLVAGDSPFDRYLLGGNQNAISEDAKEGFRLFVRKGRCSGCHQVTGTAAPFTDDNFHSTGIGFADGNYADDGRFEVTHDPADKGAFQTPTLRNVALRPYFMHDGSLTSLRQVLDYYNRGGNRGAGNLDGRIQPLLLIEGEIKDMLAFLDTLNSRIVSYRPWLAQTAVQP
jgi:cytochrome c peroxidase